MTHAPEPTATATESAADTGEATAEPQHVVPAPADEVPDRRPAPVLSEENRRAARQLLAGVFIAAGITHLTHQRFYRSVLPYWLLGARREVDVGVGAAQVFGGVLLLMPRLHKFARWTNLVVLTPALLAGIGEARRPGRVDPFTRFYPGLSPVGPAALAPGHAALAVLLWWATGGE